MEITFKTTKGNSFTGTVKNDKDNTLLVINGVDFFGISDGFQTYKGREFIKSMGGNPTEDSSVTLYLSKEEKERVYFLMRPNERKIELIKKYEEFDVHHAGETIYKKEDWLMADGSTRTFIISKKEL